MNLPRPRGPLSGWVLDRLSGSPIGAKAPAVEVEDPLTNHDLHLALYLCYELHYGRQTEGDEHLEWDPSLLAFRGDMERVFETALRTSVPPPPPASGSVAVALTSMVRGDSGPSLSTYLSGAGTLEQYREFLIHRSAYQLREGDAHSWAIPRLRGAPKVALMEIQHDEYGGGNPEWVHSRLFEETMTALGISSRRGAYLDLQPGSTLAWANLVSMFGLHRRSLGALVGHLAVFEMTSCIPNRRYGDGLRRLGFGEGATRYFDEHVEADAVHEQIAAHDLAGGLVSQEPELFEEVLFGAGAVLLAEALFAQHILDAWAEGRSSLLAEDALTGGVGVA